LKTYEEIDEERAKIMKIWDYCDELMKNDTEENK